MPEEVHASTHTYRAHRYVKGDTLKKFCAKKMQKEEAHRRLVCIVFRIEKKKEVLQ